MAGPVVVFILAAVLLNAYAVPLAELLVDVLQGAAVLGVAGLALWIMLRAPFDRV